MGQKIPLGSAKAECIKTEVVPQTTEERVAALEARLEAMTEAFYCTKAMLADKENTYNAYPIENSPTNKDGVPLNTSYIGIVDDLPYILTVAEDGNYYIGNVQHSSLSAAAASIGAPTRISGWRFWKSADGTSMKKLFRT